MAQATTDRVPDRRPDEVFRRYRSWAKRILVLVVSFVFSFSVGFTTVVLFSTFLSGAGEVVVGATTVLSSHAPRSAALAKIQSNFFIGLDWLPILDNG